MSGIRHGIRVRQRALESVRCAGAGVALATLPGSRRLVGLIYTNVIREMVFLMLYNVNVESFFF